MLEGANSSKKIKRGFSITGISSTQRIIEKYIWGHGTKVAHPSTTFQGQQGKHHEDRRGLHHPPHILMSEPTAFRTVYYQPGLANYEDWQGRLIEGSWRSEDDGNGALVDPPAIGHRSTRLDLQVQCLLQLQKVFSMMSDKIKYNSPAFLHFISCGAAYDLGDSLCRYFVTEGKFLGKRP
ncbi:hypothetical protein HPB48_026744 [Haemaphysalis longicornis]|uniref:Uncharacterized protein n=1 Tax=Haemaphysalis longicornis TaxID=44386 RepID=A0A9J6HBJ1_HAELO|nr:hypothetical protein HPB48_026744 [Haemaphysalis longicornis]